MKIICFILLSFVAIHTTAQDSESIQLTTPKKGTLPFEVNKNAISFNYADLAVNRVSLSYERLIKEGMLGIKVPVSFSINSKPNGPKYYGGLGLNYYPLGQRKLTYYTGITTHLGVYSKNYTRYISWYYDANSIPRHTYERVRSEHVFGAAYITNGLGWNITKNFSIAGQIGIGVRDIGGKSWGGVHVTGELNATIRF